MFGLMKLPARLPYCGTCKTIGARYGHGARILLNHDTVFLAELLIEAADQAAPDKAAADKVKWSRAYRSRNCLARVREEEIPLPLDYSAAATVVLTHFRVEDAKEDRGGWHWRWASRILSPTYQKAANRLRAWGFPLDDAAAMLGSQAEREQRCASLAAVAEPTASVTALFFQHGARLIQRPELCDDFSRAGHRFGYLIYTLDAWEDRERDRKQGQFNPLLAMPHIDGEAEIWNTVAELEALLPNRFSARLRANLERRMRTRGPVVCERGCETECGMEPASQNSPAPPLVALAGAVPPPPPRGFGGGHSPYRPTPAVPPARPRGGSCWTCCRCADCACCTTECCCEGCCEGCCESGACCNCDC